MQFFLSPSKIFFGKDALNMLSTIGGKRAFIVTGESAMRRLGFVDKVEGLLKAGKLETRVFEGVKPDPSLTTCLEGVEELQKFKPDWIVALGGGSSIDAARMMWVLYEHPEMTLEKAASEVNAVKDMGNKAKFIAIPSTSGTGAEVTLAGVITDPKTRVKRVFGSFDIVPTIAIVDPEIAASMPPRLAASTAFDALTHAVGAYHSKMANDFTDPLAIKAIQMVFEYLPLAYSGTHEKAREKMHYAATIAGLAFGNSFPGIDHSMAHALGSAFHLPHGVCCANALPSSMQYNAKVSGQRNISILKALGDAAETPEEATDKLVSNIKRLRKDVDLPASIKEAGIAEKQFQSKLNYLVETAEKDVCTQINPRDTSAEDFRRLFQGLYEGKDVDF
jgi:alcohol dehydrogenase class IV